MVRLVPLSLNTFACAFLVQALAPVIVVQALAPVIVVQALAPVIVVQALAPLPLSASPVMTSNGAVQEQTKFLKGGLTHVENSPIIEGQHHDVPAGVPVNLTMVVNLNTELSKVGDGVVAMVSSDSRNDGKTVLPGQWWVAGRVVEVQGQKRLGRDGYITVHFDKLVSPDNKYDIPIDVTATTKDSTAKTVTKVLAKDSYIVTKGAAIGAIRSVQFTGIPMAIASHGYSVAGGAAIGATIGFAHAVHRKGKVKSAIQGEELTMRLDKPVTLPAFNDQALPSAAPIPHVDNLDISVAKVSFRADPFGDSASRLLKVDFAFDNQTDHEYSFGNIAVVSDHNQMFYPYVLSDLKVRQKRVPAKSKGAGTITFSVNTGKHKYWLVLLDSGQKNELARVPIQ